MIDLIQHIEYLLRHHNCVIVPNIGAFIVSYKSAYINDEWGILTPPMREVYFNSSITNNDGLLANSIARKEKISFEAASRIMMQEIERLKTILFENKELNIGRVGNLHIGEENNLLFEPFKKHRQADAFWGLQPLRLASLEEQLRRATSPENVANHRRSDKNYYIPINKRFVHYAAMFILVFLATISLSLPSDNTKTVQNYAAVVPVTASTVKKIVASTSTPVAEQQPAVEQAEEPQIQAPESNVYYLIVASLSSDEEALKFIESCAAEDSDLKVVSTASMSRVYAAKSSNRDELTVLLNSSEFQARHSQAWIWKSKR